MRGVRLVLLVLVSMLVMLVVAAASASAKKANLVLREGGAHLYEGLDPAVPVGAPVEVSFRTEVGDCSPTFPATMAENGLRTDTVLINEFEPEPMPCSGEYEGKQDQLEFGWGEVEVSSKGKVKVDSVFNLYLWGPVGECRYAFALYKAKITIPVPAPGTAGSAVVNDTIKSFVRPSNKLCPKKQEVPFSITLSDNGGYPLETTLEG